MGLFDFGKRRRERERAMQPPAPAEFRSLQGDGKPIGQQVEHQESAGPDLDALGGLGGLGSIMGAIGEAARTGSFQVVSAESHQIQVQGKELQEQVLAALRRHGVDPQSGSVTGGSVTDPAALNAEIMEALRNAGIDPANPAGSGADEAGDGR